MLSNAASLYKEVDLAINKFDNLDTKQEIIKQFNTKYAETKEKLQHYLADKTNFRNSGHIAALTSIVNVYKSISTMIKSYYNEKNMKQPVIVENIVETPTDEVKNKIKDLLFIIKSNGFDKIETEKVMKEIEKSGMSISLDSLQQMLTTNADFIKDVNNNYIVFNTDSNEFIPWDRKTINKSHVSKMASSAVKRRM